MVLSRKSSRRPLPALPRCSFSSSKVSDRSSDCTEEADCGVSQLGGMGGDSSSWSGEGGGEEEAEECGCRCSREGSGAGLKVVDISGGIKQRIITRVTAWQLYASAN